MSDTHTEHEKVENTRTGLDRRDGDRREEHRRSRDEQLPFPERRDEVERRRDDRREGTDRRTIIT